MTQLSAIPTETWLRTGPVTTPADLEAVFGLRYQVYCQERRYLDCADYPDALESDAYDGHAVHFAAFDQCGSVAAAARLVLPVAGRGFPFQQHASVFDSARLPPAECSAEGDYGVNVLRVAECITEGEYVERYICIGQVWI